MAHSLGIVNTLFFLIYVGYSTVTTKLCAQRILDNICLLSELCSWIMRPYKRSQPGLVVTKKLLF